MSHVKYVGLLYTCRSHMSVDLSSFSFKLHDNALALHEYTRGQRKKAAHGEGPGFGGELDIFQEPELSSLVKLVRFRHSYSVILADDVGCRI
jgi:hypothetical protein